jgi:hypothetical protein
MTEKAEASHHRQLVYRVIPEYETDSGDAFEHALDALLHLLNSSLPETAQRLMDALEQPGAPKRPVLPLLAQKKQFILAVLRERKELPDVFLAPLMRAALYEDNPSANRWFIVPAIRAFGFRRVHEVLLEYLEHGTDREKAGATRAYYWAEVGLVYEGLDNYRKGQATTLSQQAYDALADLRSKIASAMLKEFIENEHLDVRRSLIPLLSFNPADYPEAYEPLIQVALHLARTHPDEYIRHRVEIQVRQSGHLRRVSVFFRKIHPGDERAGGLCV